MKPNYWTSSCLSSGNAFFYLLFLFPLQAIHKALVTIKQVKELRWMLTRSLSQLGYVVTAFVLPWATNGGVVKLWFMLTVDPHLRRRDLRPSAFVNDILVKEALKVMTETRTYDHYTYKTTQKQKYQISCRQMSTVSSQYSSDFAHFSPFTNFSVKTKCDCLEESVPSTSKFLQ
jgi:hypothetical protein